MDEVIWNCWFTGEVFCCNVKEDARTHTLLGKKLKPSHHRSDVTDRPQAECNASSPTCAGGLHDHPRAWFR